MSERKMGMQTTYGLAKLVGYDQMTGEQKQAFDARHGIKAGDREASEAALARIEDQARSTRRQIELIGPRNANRG